ncbi:MAG: Mur ligase family protein, partial [bacterium]
MMGPVAEMEKENKRTLPDQIGWLLSALVESAGLVAEIEGEDVEIKGIFDNSQKVQRKGLFVAIKGTNVDSHVFISDAVERGAKVIVVEQPCAAYPGVTLVRVKDSRLAIALLSHAFYGHPSRDLSLIGITGTNGKTTSSFLLERILSEAGMSPGLMGTIEYWTGLSRKKAFNTTPSPLEISGFLSEMVTAGCKSAVMEVSSHSIEQQRIAGLNFSLGLFTNISQDHLDFHGDMTQYIKAKQKFFSKFLAANPKGIGVFNAQDTFGRRFAEEFTGTQFTYSFDRKALVSG